jgi:glutamyl-tRNA synthetase
VPRLETSLGRSLGSDEIERLTRAMGELKPRAKNMNELAEGAAFLFKVRPLDYDEKAEQLLSGDGPLLLARIHKGLTALDEWSPEATEAAVRGVAETAGVKLGQVAQPLRAALTGRATSPGIFDVLVLLGREESLARIAERMDGEG